MDEQILISLRSGPVPVEEIPDQSISYDMLEELRLTAVQREALISKLDNAALARHLKERILPNVVPFLRRKTNPVTYDEALALLYAPELIRRLEDARDGKGCSPCCDPRRPACSNSC